MNTEVKCSIIEASSNELLYQIEVHNGLIPAYIVKKHDGPIPYIHTRLLPLLRQKNEKMPIEEKHLALAPNLVSCTF